MTPAKTPARPLTRLLTRLLARPLARRAARRPAPCRLPAALLEAIAACALLAASPAARAAEVTITTSSTLRDQMNTLTNGGTVSFQGDGLNNALQSTIAITSATYVLNLGGAEHVTITGRTNVGAFVNNTGDINLTLTNLTITRGEGSAIKSAAGTVHLALAGPGTVELANNTASGNGGAIYGHTGISITGTLDNLHIIGNSASGRTGALYSEMGGVIIDTVIADTLLLANNSAPYTGGAILAQGNNTDAGIIILTGTYGSILIQGNYTHNRNGGTGAGGALAANGLITINPHVFDTFLITSNSSVTSGGAINANGNLDITATGPAGIRFENNTAVTNGGAVYSGGDWSAITANNAAGIHFENNTAGGKGGALFINRSTPVTLDAAQGDIVFQGNTHGTTKTPNAIYGAGAGGNTLNLTGAHDILFLDPVFADSDASSITKTGSGSATFSGSSLWRGAVTIATGALLVNDGAHLDTAAPGRALTLAPGAILGTYATAVTGTLKADTLTLSGILYATGSASQLHLHGAATLNTITIRADLYNGNQSGLTILHDTAVFNGAGTVDLWSIAAASGTFNVFRYEAGTLPPGAFSSTLRYQGNIVGGAGAARVSGTVQLAADGKTLQVIIPGVISDHVTWAGAPGASWDLLTENWKLNNIAATTAIGDYVTFDDTALGRDITIEGTRLNVSGMKVDNTHDYTFAGSGGVGASPSSIGGALIAPGDAGIGKLVKTGPGKLTFAGSGANLFENGVDWHDGLISITNGNQLATGPGAALTLHATSGTLHAAGPAASTLASDIALAPGATRTLTVENTGATLDLAGTISGAGGIVLTGTGLTALTGANTFDGTVTLTQNAALALASDEALGRPGNTLVIAGDSRLAATASFATARSLDIGPRTLEITTATGHELTLNGAPGQLTGAGTIRLSGRLYAAASGVLGGATNWDIAPSGQLALTGNQTIANLHNTGALRFLNRGNTLTAATLSGGGVIAMEIDLNAGAANSRLDITGPAEGRHYFELTTIGDPGSPRDVDIPLVTYAGGDARFTSNTIVSEDGMNAYEARQRDGGGAVHLVFAGNSASADVILITAGALGMDWHYSLDNLRQRMGEVRGAVSPTGLIAGSGDMKGAMGDVWFRTNVYRLEIGNDAVVGAAFDQLSYDISAGVDRAFALGNASLLAGGFATMTRSNRAHAANNSESNSDGIGAGLYATWLAKSGWHLDIIAKYHTYKNTIDASNDDRRITRAEYDSAALGGSIELGRRLARKRLWLEPSVQAALAWFGSGDYTATSTTGRSMRISVDSSTSLQLRAQLRAGADLGRWQPHARLAGANHTTNGGTLHVAPYEYTPDFSGNRFEAGAGLTLMVDERTILYLDYEYDKAAAYERPWSVSLGLRRTW